MIILVKGVLETTVAEKIAPWGRGEIWVSVITSNHGSKPIIENNMKLGTNFAGVQVQDQRYCRRMVGRQTEKDAATRAWLPARELLAILHRRVKNIGGISPNMEIMTTMDCPFGT